ncbi:MAG: ABC transporter permease [Planctomycetota bacterium]
MGQTTDNLQATDTPRPGLVTRIDNRLNPVLVRELRRLSRGRGLAILLMLTLGLQLLVLAPAVQLADRGIGSASGGPVMSALLGMLYGLGVLMVPLLAAAHMASERRPGEVDMLYYSPMRPGDILAGKYLAFAGVYAVVVVSTLPTAVVAYLLRGVDPVQVVVALPMTVLLVQPLILAGLMLGAPRLGFGARLPVALLLVFLGGGLVGLQVVGLSVLEAALVEGAGWAALGISVLVGCFLGLAPMGVAWGITASILRTGSISRVYTPVNTLHVTGGQRPGTMHHGT